MFALILLMAAMSIALVWQRKVEYTFFLSVALYVVLGSVASFTGGYHRLMFALWGVMVLSLPTVLLVVRVERKAWRCVGLYFASVVFWLCVGAYGTCGFTVSEYDSVSHWASRVIALEQTGVIPPSSPYYPPGMTVLCALFYSAKSNAEWGMFYGKALLLISALLSFGRYRNWRETLMSNALALTAFFVLSAFKPYSLNSLQPDSVLAAVFAAGLVCVAKSWRYVGRDRILLWVAFAAVMIAVKQIGVLFAGLLVIAIVFMRMDLLAVWRWVCVRRWSVVVGAVYLCIIGILYAMLLSRPGDLAIVENFARSFNRNYLWLTTRLGYTLEVRAFMVVLFTLLIPVFMLLVLWLWSRRPVLRGIARYGQIRRMIHLRYLCRFTSLFWGFFAVVVVFYLYVYLRVLPEGTNLEIAQIERYMGSGFLSALLMVSLYAALRLELPARRGWVGLNFGAFIILCVVVFSNPVDWKPNRSTITDDKSSEEWASLTALSAEQFPLDSRIFVYCASNNLYHIWRVRMFVQPRETQGVGFAGERPWAPKGATAPTVSTYSGVDFIAMLLEEKYSHVFFEEIDAKMSKQLSGYIAYEDGQEDSPTIEDNQLYRVDRTAGAQVTLHKVVP